MKENIKKAFDFASETTKQLITLSTGIITITITFSKDILEMGKGSHTMVLITSWILFLLSIILGVWTLLALTGELEQVDKTQEGSTEENEPVREPSIRGKNVTVPSALQILFFLFAIGFAVAYGVVSLQ